MDRHEQPETGAETSTRDVAHGGLRLLGLTLSGIAGIGILGLVLLTVADVARRNLAGSSIEGAVEFSEVGLVCVVFLGMMGAQLNGRHIQTPLLTNRLPSRAAHLVRLAALVIAVLLLSWMTYETALVAVDSIERGEARYGVARVPIWPARALIPVGLGSFAIALAANAVDTLRHLLRGDEADEHEIEANL